MCIIIDVQAISCVFKKTDSKHADFAFILERLKKPNLKAAMIRGGTKYKKEIFSKSMINYRDTFLQLQKKGKFVHINDEMVNEKENLLKSQVKKLKHDFDDKHIVALLDVSGCRLFCSWDKRSFKFIGNKVYYTPPHKKVAIYSNASHIGLLHKKSSFIVTPKNITDQTINEAINQIK